MPISTTSAGRYDCPQGSRGCAACTALLVLSAAAGCAVPPAVTGTSPPEPVERRASWFDCASDLDCTIVDDAACTFASVNRRHVEEFRHYVRYEMFRVRRDRPCQPRDELGYAPICVDGKCSSRRLAGAGR